jgi:hypothetical protein
MPLWLRLEYNHITEPETLLIEAEAALCEARLPLRLLRLLTQGVECRQNCRAMVIGIDLDIVTLTVGRKEPIDPFGGE